MGHTVVKDDRYFYLPEGVEEPPETELEALKAGRSLLAEEGRWIRYSVFSNPRPQEDPSTPFCDGWGSCAVGGVRMVTIGLGKHQCYYDVCPHEGMLSMWDNGSGHDDTKLSLYRRSCERLHEATRHLTRYPAGTTYGDRDQSRFARVVDYNDHEETTHEQVLAVFDHAIAELEARQPA